MTAIITVLGSLFAGVVGSIARLFSVETLKFIAWRALVMFLMFVALPVVLYNVFTGLLFDFMDYAMSFMTGQGVSAFTMEFTGIGAYIVGKIQLVQAFSVFMSFVGIRFLMRFIPFFK